MLYERFLATAFSPSEWAIDVPPTEKKFLSSTKTGFQSICLLSLCLKLIRRFEHNKTVPCGGCVPCVTHAHVCDVVGQCPFTSTNGAWKSLIRPVRMIN